MSDKKEKKRKEILILTDLFVWFANSSKLLFLLIFLRGCNSGSPSSGAHLSPFLSLSTSGHLQEPNYQEFWDLVPPN